MFHVCKEMKLISRQNYNYKDKAEVSSFMKFCEGHLPPQGTQVPLISKLLEIIYRFSNSEHVLTC